MKTVDIHAYFFFFFQKLMLGLRYEDFSWDLGKPNKSNLIDHLPCIFIQFVVIENGARVSKIMQIFSKQVPQTYSMKLRQSDPALTRFYFARLQADMMDALINTFVTNIKCKKFSTCGDEVDDAKSSDLSGNSKSLEK